MSNLTLSKTETKILTEAASREGGLLLLPDTMKEVSRQRLLGRLESTGLIAPAGQHGDDPALTTAGYRAVGLRPPRVRKAKAAEASTEAGSSPAEAAPAAEVIATDSTRPGTKQALIISLLGRPEGASQAEIIAATGWLPHTTRAALSRLRSAGHALTKSAREDGVTAYRIAAPEPEPKRRSRKAAAPAEAAAA
ncbi:DUF3489 domain-containing protein [uncultured Enterovirga sp.]|uniref:DUF3489 domain-containing protein n=1 Tax=uncultured Enterovirga sp. TaxID=2026352 RepID=UPI0035CB0387